MGEVGEMGRFLRGADGNNVYGGEKGLLRSWPAGGPKELWRQTLGLGKNAVAERQGSCSR